MNHRRQARKRPTGGYTLLEMSIVLIVLASVVGAMVTIGLSSDRTYQTGTTAAHLEAQTEIAVERIVADLRIARLSSLTPDPAPGSGVSSIEYVQPVGITNGVVQYGSLRRLAFEYAPGEINDGRDNNGNGLVDEGRVVLTEDVGGAGERRHVITPWVRQLAAGEVADGRDDNGNGLVDEPGFLVERLGRRRTRTAQTSVRMRN